MTKFIIKKATRSAPKYLNPDKDYYFEKGDWVCQAIGSGSSGTTSTTNKLTKKYLKTFFVLVKENDKNKKVKKK